MALLLTVILVTVIVRSTNSQSEYCNICNNHTLCIYAETGIGRACTMYIDGGVNNESRSDILDIHNELRRQVSLGLEKRGNPGPQPAAKNIADLDWDDELAASAQKWVDQCEYGHDVCRNVTRFQVGQNVYFSQSSVKFSDNDWRAAIQFWYNEVEYFSPVYISPYKFDFETAHYTQVVWADTHLLGCGYSSYQDADGMFNQFYACNYGPAGNVESSAIYKTEKYCRQEYVCS